MPIDGVLQTLTNCWQQRCRASGGEVLSSDLAASPFLGCGSPFCSKSPTRPASGPDAARAVVAAFPFRFLLHLSSSWTSATAGPKLHRPRDQGIQGPTCAVSALSC